MSRLRCPGQDPQNWKPDDIHQSPCIHCGRMIEFFKDDLRRKCPECGKYTVNPRNDLSCASWCKHARECLGQMPEPAETDEAK